jgi:hypothetical protein
LGRKAQPIKETRLDIFAVPGCYRISSVEKGMHKVVVVVDAVTGSLIV